MKKDELKDADIVEVFGHFNFMKVAGEPLHEKDTKFLMNMILAVQQDGIETIDKDKDEEGEQMHKFVNGFPMGILRNRLESVGYTISDYAIIFLSLASPSAGTVVMYAAYFAYVAKEKGLKHIGLMDVCQDCFPWGIPSDETLHKHWDLQKVHANKGTKQYDTYMNPPKGRPRGTDNLLDYGVCWRNLKYEEK